MGNRWRWTRVAAGTHWSQCIHLTHECHSCSAATALGMAEGHVVVRNPSNLAASFCLPKKDQPAPRKKGVHAAPARPQPPCHPLGSARCSLVCFRARRVHASGVGGGTGDSHRSSAAGAAQRAPTSSSCSAPQKNRLAGSPDPCARPLARPFLPHRPREPQRPPQRAVPCTAHRSYKTSRDTHRTCAAAPTRPQRTRCSREGIDAQGAHWQVSGYVGYPDDEQFIAFHKAVRLRG